MVGRNFFCAAFAVMVVGSSGCWGGKKKTTIILTPANYASQLTTIADKYIFRGTNIEKEWFEMLNKFFESIDSSIAKMPKFGLSKLSKDNKDLIANAKQFVLEFGTKFFSALRGNAGAEKETIDSYPNIEKISESFKPNTGVFGLVGGDSDRTMEIKKSLQSVLGTLKKIYQKALKQA